MPLPGSPGENPGYGSVIWLRYEGLTHVEGAYMLRHKFFAGKDSCNDRTRHCACFWRTSGAQHDCAADYAYCMCSASC